MKVQRTSAYASRRNLPRSRTVTMRAVRSLLARIFTPTAPEPGDGINFNDLTDEKLLWVKNYVGTDLANAFLAAFPLHSLFQDNLGQLPVYAVEQPIGLALDMRFGGLRGPQIVTNGGFDTAAGWTLGAGWSISGGKATVTGNAAASNLTWSAGIAAPVNGEFYEVKFDYVSTTGRVRFNPVAGNATPLAASGSSGTYRAIVALAGGDPSLIVQAPDIGSTISIDNVSVQRVYGYHLTQATVGDRPVMDGRTNRLTQTENLADNIWVKSNAGTGTVPVVTNNFGVAPDGTTTATRLQMSTGGGNTTGDISRIYYPLVSTVGAFYTESVWLKTNDGSTKTISFRDDNSITKNVNITVTGVWQKFQPTNQAANNTQVNAMGLWVRGNVGTDLSVDLLVWHPHAERTNSATQHGSYQRVGATAADYDGTGFPKGARFNGVNSWMSGLLDLSASDKVVASVAMRRDSDATTAVVVELGTNSASVAGTFAVFAPSANATAGVGFRAMGSASSLAISAAAPAAPANTILSGVLDMAAPLMALRRDGVQAASDTTTRGAGNLANQTLYVGRRGGTSLPFNGVIYRIGIRGGLADNFIALMERWANEPVKVLA
jgi:hypothetical protein